MKIFRQLFENNNIITMGSNLTDSLIELYAEYEENQDNVGDKLDPELLNRGNQLIKKSKEAFQGGFYQEQEESYWELIEDLRYYIKRLSIPLKKDFKSTDNYLYKKIKSFMV